MSWETQKWERDKPVFKEGVDWAEFAVVHLFSVMVNYICHFDLGHEVPRYLFKLLFSMFQ